MGSVGTSAISFRSIRFTGSKVIDTGFHSESSQKLVGVGKNVLRPRRAKKSLRRVSHLLVTSRDWITCGYQSGGWLEPTTASNLFTAWLSFTNHTCNKPHRASYLPNALNPKMFDANSEGLSFRSEQSLCHHLELHEKGENDEPGQAAEDRRAWKANYFNIL